jgi:hypothetical protein
VSRAKDLAKEINPIGLDMETEIMNDWQDYQRDGLEEMLKDNSLEDLISYYEHEAIEFIDCLLSASRAYLLISIQLHIRKIIRDHCEK